MNVFSELKLNWIENILVNDEMGTDEELKEHFIMIGNLSRDEADFYINQRDAALKDPLNFKLKPYKGA